jgi:hypothetical protein
MDCGLWKKKDGWLFDERVEASVILAVKHCGDIWARRCIQSDTNN